jgi:hypothetical protein
LELHLRRLEESAKYFRFDYNKDWAIQALMREAETFKDRKYRVRLLLYKNGEMLDGKTQLALLAVGLSGPSGKWVTGLECPSAVGKIAQYGLSQALLWGEVDVISEASVKALTGEVNAKIEIDAVSEKDEDKECSACEDVIARDDVIAKDAVTLAEGIIYDADILIILLPSTLYPGIERPSKRR